MVPQLKILVLCTDAFGGHGGIAKFNRDLLSALCACPEVEEAVALPRLQPEPPGALPDKLRYDTGGVGGKLRYLVAAVRTARRSQELSTLNSQLSAPFDLILCGHINLLPAAFLARAMMPRKAGGRSGESPRPSDGRGWPAGPGEGTGEVSSGSTLECGDSSPLSPPGDSSPALPRQAAATQSAAKSAHSKIPPIALIIHGIDAWQPTRSALVNRLVRKIDAFIAVSEFTRKRFLAWAFPDNVASGIVPDVEPGVSPGGEDARNCTRAEKAKEVPGGRMPPSTAVRMAAATGPRSFILPNCVDLEQFTPGPKNPALLDRYGLHDRTVLLTVARLSADERYKGIDEVLEILPQLVKQIPNLTYLIVGDGTDRARLMAKADSLGLTVTDAEARQAPGAERPAVLFTGRIPESEKVDHYRLADAFVMPGRGEGFGIVYLEALACGVPVVASKADASQEIVACIGEGIAVDPDNPDELVQVILQLLKTRTCVVAPKLLEFSWESFCRRCHEILTGTSFSEGKQCLKVPAARNVVT